MNQARFAEVLRTTQSNVSKWESGSYPPSPELFLRLSNLAPAGDDATFFLEQAHGVSSATGKALDRIDKAYRAIPLVAEPAGAGPGSLHESKNIEGRLSLPHDLVTGEMACVRIHGDSMEPLIPDRSIAAVDCFQVNAKKLEGRVIAAQNDVDGVVVKRLRNRDGRLWLVSENPMYSPVEFKKGWRIVGRVEWWIVRQK